MRRTLLRPLFVVIYLALCQVTLQAQDLNTLMTDANQQWKEKEYAQCQITFSRIVKMYGPRSAILYGPKFGVVYYRKGLAELKLAHLASKAKDKELAKRWYTEAIKSFKTCYEKFPNNADGMPKTTNTTHTRSLQRLAEAKMGVGEYKKTIELYQKFEKQRNQTDKYLPTQGSFHLNLAISHLLLIPPKITEGLAHFEIALKNKESMKTSDAGIKRTFQILNNVKKNNSAILSFLDKHRKHHTDAEEK